MALEYKDYYKILGVDKNADEQAIKQAYRRLARKYHPDLNKSTGSADRFKEINEANEVLSDPEKRRRYDTLGPDWQRYAAAGAQTPQGPFPPGGVHVEYGDLGDLGGFSDFFRTIFGDLGARRAGGGADAFEQLGGGRARGAARGRGQDVQASVEITLEEAFHGTRKAALGATIDVPTLKGKVSMKIPPGTGSGRTFRLPGYGIPRLRGRGAGDQLVRIRIVVPSSLTAEERALYEKLKALRGDDPRAYLG